jgi:peptide/nickel transport system ATP-binding protein
MTAMQKDDPLLEVEGLTVAFGEQARPALENIHFRLHRNEILGIVGETGAGKSVLARALIDLLPAGGVITKGDIRLAGRSIRSMGKEELRRLRGGRIALIGTNAKALLDPVEKVGTQIARVLQAHRGGSKQSAWRAAVDLMREVGIVDPEKRARAYPHQLSGGMAQRIVIAMAMVAGPEVVLADDATLGLDATVQVQVLDLLVERCRQLGLAVVLITHDLGIVAHYCDRVAIMRRGEIVELGPVQDFLKAPQETYSIDLLHAAKARPTPIQDHPDGAGRSPAVASEPAPLLDVADLVKHFPVSGTRDVVRAVDGVSFKIARGETMALVGESGSGKTTVGQCLVHLLRPDSGRVLFDGQDVTFLAEREFRKLRWRIQMVFQEPYVALNPRWPVRKLIGEALALEDRTGAEKMQRVRELLDMVQLPARLADVYPHELTAGEQKRVGMARALATSPDFVVFDEPTTALDIRVRAQIIDLIRRLQREMGLTALFITHDLNSVRSLAHYVAVMRRGEIVEYGETEQIFAHPKESYTRALLSAELPIEREMTVDHAHESTLETI